MKLSKVRVQNYRAIVDSGIVEIEDRVTVLIGKNEQGKTTFLKALASADAEARYTPGDLPSHLQPELEKQKAAEIPVVTLWFSPSEGDSEALRLVISDCDDIEYFRVVKYYDNHRAFWIGRKGRPEEPLKFPPPDVRAPVAKLKLAAEQLQGKLAAHSERLESFATHLPQANSVIDAFRSADLTAIDQIDNLVQTFTTGLTSVPGQDELIQADVAASAKVLQSIHSEMVSSAKVDKRALLDELVPKFVYHSTTLDQIPNDVLIADFVESPNNVSRGMANLCAVAGLSMQKIQELASSSDSHIVERFEDYYKASVSGAINEFWTQEEYTVNFRFNNNKMSVSISDSTYQGRIPPRERSEGFQWYLSFYATLQNEVATAGPIAFLLDNPALEIHADGQRDIKRFLEEKLMPDAQIVYVTHSPAMIDPFRLDQVRKVELQPDLLGTKVSPLEIKDGDDFDLFDPVRTAIGASLATSLILNEYNVLVEGAADKPILEGAFEAFQRHARHRVLINGSVSESKDGFLVRFYERAGVPFVVYLDADSSGRDLAEGVKRWISEDRILNLRSVFPERNGDFEIEDIFSADVYHAAVKAEYPMLEGPAPTEGVGKRTKRYDRLFREKHNQGFNKRRVAERLKNMMISGEVDQETLKNLTALTAAILDSLDRQLGRVIGVEPGIKRIADTRKAEATPPKLQLPEQVGHAEERPLEAPDVQLQPEGSSTD